MLMGFDGRVARSFACPQWGGVLCDQGLFFEGRCGVGAHWELVFVRLDQTAVQVEPFDFFSFAIIIVDYPPLDLGVICSNGALKPPGGWVPAGEFEIFSYTRPY